MKTTVLILCAALAFTLTCEAQTEKGVKMIGGSGSVSFGEFYRGGFSPSFGYFFRDNLALGASVPLSFSGTTPKSDYGSDFNSTLTLSPLVRYYFGKLSPTRLFADARGAVGFSYNKQIWEGGSADSRITKYNSFGGGVGVAHFITEQVGLEARLVYINYQLGSNSREDNFGLRFGLQIHLPNHTEK